MCISVKCKCTARGRFCATQTLLTNLIGQLSLQGFFNPPSLPLNLIVTMLHVLCTIYMFSPIFEWQFLLYKICVWNCGIFFWGHLMYQWQFSSTIWILWLRHLMNKWQFSFNVCLLCFCPQTELACVDKKYILRVVCFVILSSVRLLMRTHLRHLLVV
jgi:hypothetical protein